MALCESGKVMRSKSGFWKEKRTATKIISKIKQRRKNQKVQHLR